MPNKTQESCEWCSSKEIIEGWENRNMSADLLLDPEYKRIDVVVSVEDEEVIEGTININFCPFCGRKL